MATPARMTTPMSTSLLAAVGEATAVEPAVQVGVPCAVAVGVCTSLLTGAGVRPLGAGVAATTPGKLKSSGAAVVRFVVIGLVDSSGKTRGIHASLEPPMAWSVV